MGLNLSRVGWSSAVLTDPQGAAFQCVDTSSQQQTAELNDFLGSESRGVTVRRSFRPHQTVKGVLEAMGIPRTEVDLILVNGNAEDSRHWQ
jgi:hypothetical protein